MAHGDKDKHKADKAKGFYDEDYDDDYDYVTSDLDGRYIYCPSINRIKFTREDNPGLTEFKYKFIELVISDILKEDYFDFKEEIVSSLEEQKNLPNFLQ